MANPLRKEWKVPTKRMAKSPLSYERSQEIKEAKRTKSEERKARLADIRRKKKEYCDMVRQREADRAAKRKLLN